MKLTCDVCGCENGSCNRYSGVLGETTICPSCLAFSNSNKAKSARNLHKTGGLIKDEEQNFKKNGKRRR